MSSINGYEIRQSILIAAKDMLFESWHAKRVVLEDNAKRANNPLPMPTPPTAEEVIELSEKLYEFVQRKG